MPHLKVDGVIDAVKYDPAGSIALVRLYQKRGFVWSDLTILRRSELIEFLRKGKKIATGVRTPYLGSTLMVDQLVALEKGVIMAGGHGFSQDHLGGVPVF